MRGRKQRMATGTHSRESNAQPRDVWALRGVCARLFKETLGSGCRVWLCRYLIPGQCVFRLAVSPLVRVWMDPASGALMDGVVDGLPAAVAATATLDRKSVV